MDQGEMFKLQHGYEWPNCSIADCEHKVCTWATDFYCAPHSLELLGDDEMIRRYNDTHDRQWDESWPPGSKESR